MGRILDSWYLGVDSCMDSDHRQALLGYQETQHLSFTPLNRLIFRKIVGLGRIGLKKQKAPIHLALLPVSAIALSPAIAMFMTGIKHILWPSLESAVYRDIWCWYCVFCQVCVYVCVFTYPCVYMWMCVMWTSQGKGRCLPPSLAWHLLFETKSPLEPGAHCSVSWALGPRGLLVFSHAHPARAVLQPHTPMSDFYIGSGIILWPSCLHGKQFPYWVIFPGLFYGFWQMDGVHHPSSKPGESCWMVGLSSGLAQWLYYAWWDVEGGLALSGLFSSARSLAFPSPSPWTHSLIYSYFPKPVASFSYLTEMPVTRTFFFGPTCTAVLGKCCISFVLGFLFFPRAIGEIWDMIM